MQNLWVQPILKQTIYKLHLKLLTKKGWSMSAKIVFSEITWSTYLSLIISAFFNRFIAKYSPDFLFFASITRPNEPKIIELLHQDCFN